MLRACGAVEERPAWSAARCWCHGLFCGKGWFKATREFRRDFRSALTSVDRLEFEELVRQRGLFDGWERRDKWVQRLEHHAQSAARFRRGGVRSTTDAAQSGGAHGQ